jgi:tRNA(Arg) A34 adenosine deaminase TadA
MTELSRRDHILLDRTYEIAWSSRQNGNHPFGALVADESGTILAEAENAVRSTGDLAAHAEVNVLHKAALSLPMDVLSKATMFTSTEPCAMCAATAYWVGIARVVYGLAETELISIIGPDPENLTLQLDCRTVLGSGQRPVAVIGPIEHPRAREVHEGFW